MGPLLIVIVLAAAAALFCGVTSVITRETSWVDRLWSIVPAVYAWVFAIAAMLDGRDSGRLTVMAVLVTLWGARLTFNFARKGGYSGMEDYRWAVLRGRMKPWQFQVFNATFIAFYQNALLLLITLPAYFVWAHPAGLTAWDVVPAVLFLLFLAGETVADQQQWNFHQAKQRAGGTLEPGFATTGLFACSRHPNFFFEQAQWWVFYVFAGLTGVVAGLGFWGGALNWTIVGAVLLTLLFIGSTRFTESISASKYPAYAAYQRRVSMLVPWPPRR
ncbi:MAG: DUF1295 domain-containing protein [Gordonia sp. (in: high G+C Gram-positive bacteria)]